MLAGSSSLIVWSALLLTLPQSDADVWPPLQQLAATPQERQILADEALPLPLLDSGLIACGAAGELELERGRSRYEQLRAEMRLPPADFAEERAAARILEELHRCVLKGEYQVGCSDLRRTLEHGDYNCVTATLLYQCLALESQRSAVAVSVPAHVFNRHRAPPAVIEVQSTCRWWFVNEGRGQLCRDADDAMQQAAAARELSPRQLVAKIYYNRGVVALQSRQFREALRLLRISVHLDPLDATARSNLLAALNNWALAACDTRDFELASRLLRCAAQLDPQYPPLLVNDLHVHHQWVMALCRSRQFAPALQILQAGRRRQPQAKLFDDGRILVAQLWATALFEEGLLEDGLEVFQTLRAEDPEEPRWIAARDAAVQTAARSLAQSGRRETAIGLVDRGLAASPNSATLRQLRQLLTGADLTLAPF